MMRVIRQPKPAEKPYAVIGSTGVVIREFYDKVDAHSFMNFIEKQNENDRIATESAKKESQNGNNKEV